MRLIINKAIKKIAEVPPVCSTPGHPSTRAGFARPKSPHEHTAKSTNDITYRNVLILTIAPTLYKCYLPRHP